MSEHENFEALIRENEPTRDESVPHNITLILQHCQEVMRLVQALPRDPFTKRAIVDIQSCAHNVAAHHANVSRDG